DPGDGGVSEGTADSREAAPEARHGLLAWWHETPLYLRILAALALGVVAGLLLGQRAARLGLPSQLILRMMGALAPPLILVAVIHSLMTARLPGHVARRLAGLLLLNTLVAIIIGLLVANVVRPGAWEHFERPAVVQAVPTKNPFAQFLENVPESLLKPLVDNNVLGVILIALAFGVALRRMPQHERHTVEDLFRLAFGALIVVL